MDQSGTWKLAGILLYFLLFWSSLGVLIIAGAWKSFEKAGEPGWAALVPIYNAVVMLRIAGRDPWLILTMLIPFANVVFAIMFLLDFAKAYGKSGGFAMGLIFLPFVFYPILGFGDSQYVGLGDGGATQPEPTPVA